MAIFSGIAAVAAMAKAVAGITSLANKAADYFRSRRERATGRMEGERDNAVATVEMQKDMAKADGTGPRTRADLDKRMHDGSF